MADEMPTLGRPRRRSRGPAVLILLVIAAGAWLGWRHWHAPRRAPTASAPPPSEPPASPPTATPRPEPAHAAADAAPEATPDGGVVPHTTSAPAPSRSARALADAGAARLHVTVEGPLETTIVRAVGAEEGPRLGQVIVRSLVWWLTVPNDLFKGDTLEALYQPRAGEDPVVLAVRYHSRKSQRDFRAYRFQVPGQSFARFYTPDGNELELRLDHAPLDDYEQVTSRLRDGRRHQGVDFKTPVGSPVHAPFDAVVVRKNWNFRGNGNSIELHERDGHGWTALFLHLSEPPSLPVGASVSRGQVVAKSGNTGHSFAPHLHYQLMAGTRVLDPFVVQPTHRRPLPPSARAAFDAEVARLDGLLDLRD